MKKTILLLLLIFGFYVANAQKRKRKEKAKDTLKTAIVNVITSYTPTLSAAYKMRKNPVIQLRKKSQKQELTYSLSPVPVASTFIPKSGVAKAIDVGVKERLYTNFIAAGFGNNTTPYVELYFRNHKKFKNEYGIYAKYLSSENSIETTPLNSSFSNINAGAFYQQKERYFDWRVGIDASRNEYNWYGLTNPLTVVNEDVAQVYSNYKINGALFFEKSYIEKIELNASQFSDNYDSNEFLFSLNGSFQFPLNRFWRRLKELQIATSIEFLNGKFDRSYTSNTPINYGFFTLNINPYYEFYFANFEIKAGLKMFASLDAENSSNNLLLYPDVKISYPVLKDYLTIFSGVTGHLHTNSYQHLAEINPYISPTLFLTQTHEKYNLFGGIEGRITPDLGFRLKGTYKTEQDKLLFAKNNHSNTNTNGYANGNSFGVVYDDVSTVSIFGELEMDITKRMVVGTNAQFHMYTLKNEEEAWNLPTIEATLFSKYKMNKWYAGIDLFFIGERKDRLYSSAETIENLESYLDLNANGGYHFNDWFSAFIKLNNILNADYQRFSNFNVQGFQVLGGITYKFDF